jgi:N-acetylneuraminic acid mutarotase
MTAYFLSVLVYSLLNTAFGADVSDITDITWSSGPQAVNDFQYHATASQDARIYVAGGSNSQAAVLDTRTKEWLPLPALPTPRDFPAGTVLNGSFYVLGGIDSTHGSTTLTERYDIASGKWLRCAPMLTPRSRFVAITYKGQLYVFGGLEVDPEGTYGNVNSVECYDPITNMWVFKSPMSLARHGHAAVISDNVVYVAGGYTDTGQTAILEKYDPVTDTWTTGTPMLTPRGFFGFVAIHDEFYAIAGRVHSETGAIEQYNVHADKWISLSPLPKRRNRFGCVAIGSEIYIIGAEEAPREVLIGRISR